MIRAAPAAVRNAPPLLEALRRELSAGCRLFEIGSGDGYHAAFFSEGLRGVEWHASEVPDRAAFLQSSLETRSRQLADRVQLFDVNTGRSPGTRFDAVFSCNTAHILSLESVRNMFRRSNELLSESGRFLLYGPFRIDGKFTSESNAAFDRQLQRQHPDMGIRELEALDEFAAEQGMGRSRLYAMPSNNLMVVWSRRSQGTKLSQLSD